jgi:hypothetical protein
MGLYDEEQLKAELGLDDAEGLEGLGADLSADFGDDFGSDFDLSEGGSSRQPASSDGADET